MATASQLAARLSRGAAGGDGLFIAALAAFGVTNADGDKPRGLPGLFCTLRRMPWLLDRLIRDRCVGRLHNQLFDIFGEVL